MLAPCRLDAEDPTWPFAEMDAVVAINMAHIAPWSASAALMRGAAQVLRPGGILFLYGPFFEPDAEPSPGNLRFDEALRASDPRWGVRALSDIVALAAGAGLRLRERIPMPAGNLSLIFTREAEEI